MVIFTNNSYTGSKVPLDNIIIIRILLVFWFIAKVMSYKVWLAYRNFPIVAPFDVLNNIPGYIHLSLYIISSVLFLFLLVRPDKVLPAGLLVLSEIASCSLDVTRWQPWEYQYIFLLISYYIYNNNRERFYNAVAVILISVYLYSGLHKFNGGFLYSIWEQMILKKFCGIHLPVSIYTHYLGLFIPFTEITAGVLLSTKYRLKAGMVIIAMHLFILILIGPFGNNYNSIVWPWNVAMILLTYTIFIKGNTKINFILFYKNAYGKILILFWLILPAFSFVNLWDHYLSSSLYSGKLSNLAICADSDKNSAAYFKYATYNNKYNLCKGSKVLLVNKWALAEINVPPYPEEWYYRKFIRQFRNVYSTDSSRFMLYSYPYKSKQELK